MYCAHYSFLQDVATIYSLRVNNPDIKNIRESHYKKWA